MFPRLLVVIVGSALLFGCASMLNHAQNRAEVIGPPGMSATDRRGDSLTIVREDDQQFVTIPTFDSFITFHYGNSSERVGLERSLSGWTLLNIENLGIGFIVDDALAGWRGYDPLYVYLDSTGNVDSSFHPYQPDFWESQARPRLLIAGAWGIHSAFKPPSQPFFLPPYFEYAVGLSFRHRYELFYRGSTSFDVNLFGSESQNSGNAAIGSVILRAYPWKGFFIESGPSFMTLRADSALPFSNGQGTYTPNSQRESIPGIAAGVGWSGDFSYIECNYEYSLKQYQLFDERPRNFRELVVTLGLIFRI